MPQSKNYSDIYFSEIDGNICVGDSQGNHILLGGAGRLHLWSLSSHADTVLNSNHKSFTCAAWKPNSSDYFITSSLKSTSLWQSVQGDFKVKSTFNGYSRNVCDLDWNTIDSNLIATSAHTNFSFILDSRDFKKPCCCIESVLPIYQLRWHKSIDKGHQLATCHGEMLNVWDLRNLKTPMLQHSLRSDQVHIDYIDWCPYSPYYLVSSSSEGTIKFWDLKNPNDDVDNSITLSQANIVCVKYTPRWRGIVAQCVSKSPSELHLWSLNEGISNNKQLDTYSIVDSYKILQWFFQSTEEETQLVAWSSDHYLKFWNISTFLDKNFTEASEKSVKSPVIEEKVIEKKPHKASKHPHSPLKKHQFAHHEEPHHHQKLVQFENKLPYTIIEKNSLEDRELRVLIEVKGVKVRMGVKKLDPSSKPEFTLLPGSNISTKERIRLFEMLNATIKTTDCIETCLNSTLLMIEAFQGRRTPPEKVAEAKELSKERLVGENIPFPRTSGARFCGPGFLVCFTRKVFVETSTNNDDDDEEVDRRKIQSESNMGTPRAMSALSDHCKNLNIARSLPISNPTISQFHESFESSKKMKKENRQKVRFKPSKNKSPKSYKRSLGPVIVYDLSCLLPVQKFLGENYVFDRDSVEMCRQNALVAQEINRRDLHQLWSLVALQLKEAEEKKSNIPWPLTPFGRTLIHQWVDHYSKMKDVQTLAMLSCVLTPAKLSNGTPVAAKDFNLHRTFSIFVTSCNPIPGQIGKRKHSNSLSETPPSHHSESKRPDPLPPTITKLSLLPTTLTSNDCKNFVHSYSSILFQWGFNHQRTQLVNAINQGDKDVIKNFAGSKKQENTCVICRMPVPGLYVFCFECGHGGHVRHLSAWFNKHEMCAMGCGCHCLS